MAYDKVVDSAALDAAMTYTANRIRNKTGGTDQITWDSAKGFGDAVDAITSGSSAPESDPREVYQGTRPAEWLRLPDYDKVEEDTIYFLLKLFPNGENKVSFSLRFSGICTISAGEVSNGAFVQYADDTPVSVTGTGSDDIVARTFNFADYPQNQMTDGSRQIVVRLSAPSGFWRIHYAGTPYRENSGIMDMIINASSSTMVFMYGVFNYSCQYYYVFQGQISYRWPGAKYVKSATNICIPNQTLQLGNLISFLGTVKLKNYGSTFRLCSSLETLECDISEITSWNQAFYASNPCWSLRKLRFIGGENLTSFPGDINLSSTNLTTTEVLAFFNTLPDISTSDTRTITLKSTPAVAEGIPESTLAVATNKGWTVVTA